VKRSAVFLLAMLCALLCSACSKQGAAGGGPSSNSLSIALPINPTQLNPILEQNSVENFVDGLIFSELVTIDTQGHEVPDLAAVVPTQQNGGISKDGLTVTYHLRPNAKWQDGAPVTSKDVKFTWQAIMSPKNNVVSHTGYNQIASIDMPDDHTVVLHMKQVFPPAVDTIFGESDTPYRVLPSHLLASYPSLNDVPFNADPVGSGAYRFARWLRGDRIVLEANPSYYGAAPKIKELVLKIIPDGNTTESQLRTGEAQLGMEITQSTFNDLANDSHVTRQLVSAPSYSAVYFNTSRPGLTDARVRRAIALAINRPEIIRDETSGTATLAIADLTPFSWAYDPSLKPTPYDPAQAKQLLDAAGWAVGSGGIRVKNGQRLSLQLAYGQGSQSVRNITVEVQQMLRQVGIDIELKSYDYSLLYAAAESGGIYNSGKFDLALYAWISGADPDDSSQWLCNAVPPNGNNVTRYCSKDMDAAQHLALSTFDRTVRKRAYSQVQQILLRDMPAIVLYYQRQRYAHVPELQDFTPNGVSEGWNVAHWTL
jgi:peptide/nickel transport system substrate-binding protein